MAKTERVKRNGLCIPQTRPILPSMADSRSTSLSIDAALSDLGIDPTTTDAKILQAVRKLVAANHSLTERVADLGSELENARTLADKDPLCPVLNRRAFTRELEREIALAIRHEHDVSLLFIDLDHFKQVNDEHGHHVGDQVLKTVAQTLNEGVRKTDIVGRLGGDEFGVILVRANQIDADARLARLAARLDEDLTQQYNVSASIGLAAWQRGQSVDELMAAADQTMFENKALSGSR